MTWCWVWTTNQLMTFVQAVFQSTHHHHHQQQLLQQSVSLTTSSSRRHRSRSPPALSLSSFCRRPSYSVRSSVIRPSQQLSLVAYRSCHYVHVHFCVVLFCVSIQTSAAQREIKMFRLFVRSFRELPIMFCCYKKWLQKTLN